MEELERLETDCAGQFQAQVWFLQPEGKDLDWVKAELWRTASAMPGVTVHVDRDGAEARRFHAETSGETVLYNTGGRLLFKGGITLSRGHIGDNPGEDSIAEALKTGAPASKNTPTFGCPLFGEGCGSGGAACSLPASGS